MLITYHYDANAILQNPVKNRQDNTITQAWKKINIKFSSAGIQPYTYIMNNEASNHLNAALINNDVTHQLVPPHYHIVSLSEWTIHTFKNHLKAGLEITYAEYPAAEWYRLIPHVEVILNLLRAA